MGYKDTQVQATLRHVRHQRVENRESDKNKREAAAALLDLSNFENRPSDELEQSDVGFEFSHETCIKKISLLQIENRQLYKELERLQKENTELRNELVGKQTLEEDVTSDDAKVQFYTGVPSKAIFMWLLGFCASVVPVCKVLSPTSVLLCILMKLRLNLQHQDLAYRFSVSSSTVSCILNNGLPKLADKLSFFIQWPHKECIIKNMPRIIKSTYPNCVSIIDFFEVFIQRPGPLTARAQTWSNYKHNNTIKLFVSITPTGAISFVSKAFGGRTSDKVITQRSGYLDKLQYGDQVLADRGFLMAEDLANHNATLVIPAFTRGKSQLSARDVETTAK